MRTMNKLTAIQVQQAQRTRPPMLSDGGGLYLQRGSSWDFRFKRDGKERHMGLGPACDVSLAEARARASAARKLLADGLDPIAVRRASEAAAKRAMTFSEVADDLIASKGPQWRSEKHKAQWRMTLDVYAASLRDKLPAEITTADVLAVLKPIWQSRPETASRLRGRIEIVLDAARALGHISEDKANVARWRGHLDRLLATRTRLSRGHHKALPFAEVPAFVAKLRAIDTTGARAIELIILTVARMGEALGMTKDEIDWERKIWTVPATRIKAGRPHRVPLVGRALEIIRGCATASDSHYVFPGHRHGRPLSHRSVELTLRTLEADATCHGFRSSFADWRGDATRFPRELAEAALAHVIGDQTEAAYRRGDALERRREMMNGWARYCEGRARMSWRSSSQHSRRPVDIVRCQKIDTAAPPSGSQSTSPFSAD